MNDSAERQLAERNAARVFGLFCGAAVALSLWFALSSGDAAGNSRAGALWVFSELAHLGWLGAAAAAIVAYLTLKATGGAAQPAPNGTTSSLGALLLPPLIFVTAFVVFWSLADQRASGDFERVLFDVQNNVLLLKAEPLSPLIFWLWAKLAAPLGWPLELVLRVLICLSGAAGTLAVYYLTGQLTGGQRGLHALSFAAVMSTGASALFFGHIETYTIPAVAMLWFLVAAVRYLDDGRGLLIAAGLFSFACAVHMQMLCLLPALMYLVQRQFVTDRRLPPANGAAALALLPLLLLQMLALHFPPPYPQFYGGGDGRMLVPVSLLFGWNHLTAVANTYLLAAPLAWLVALVLGVAALARFRFQDPRTNFLLLAAAGWVAFTVLWQPDLGAWKDWDLFIAVGFPVTALAAYLARVLLPPRFALGTLAFIVVVHLVRTLPFLAYNAGAF